MSCTFVPKLRLDSCKVPVSPTLLSSSFLFVAAYEMVWVGLNGRDVSWYWGLGTALDIRIIIAPSR